MSNLNTVVCKSNPYDCLLISYFVLLIIYWFWGRSDVIIPIISIFFSKLSYMKMSWEYISYSFVMCPTILSCYYLLEQNQLHSASMRSTVILASGSLISATLLLSNRHGIWNEWALPFSISIALQLILCPYIQWGIPVRLNNQCIRGIALEILIPVVFWEKRIKHFVPLFFRLNVLLLWTNVWNESLYNAINSLFTDAPGDDVGV